MNASPHEKILKPEQAAAAYTIDRHISVTAGPGSGKTTVLVERYLHILRESKNLNIDQIVAITFTNRAANEMRERLRKHLDRILAESAGDERRRWMRYKRTLDGAVINTIHGFCALLLREFPVEARIDPQFLLLDAHDAAIMLEAAVEEALTEFISSGRKSISQLALGFGRSRLAEALVQLYWNVRGQGLKLDELKQRTLRSHSTPEAYIQALSELDKIMSEFIGFGRLTPAAEAKRLHARSKWPALRELIETSPASLADYCNSIEGFRSAARPSKNSALGSLIERMDIQLWGEKKGLLGVVPQICFDLQAKDYALEVIDVLKEVERRYREKKQSLAALDFDDLQLRALELLEQPAVLTRATERYRFFLVDEFQDTNSVQRELMHRLTLGSGAARANLFIVGDRKQSIYGFRGADVDVFQQTTQTLKTAGGLEQPLHLNFRSQPGLIHFINYLFQRLFQRDEEARLDQLPELGFVDFEASREQRAQEDASPLVELLIDTKSPADDDPKAQKTQAERDAKQVAQRILALTENDGDRGVEFRDIALLFRAMTDVPAYEAVLRNANIPFQTVQGKGFYQREEISDLIQLLRFLDNKSDELALAAVLRSPLGGISDNALLALRCAPLLNEADGGNELSHFTQPRKLFYALRRHREIAYISAAEHVEVDRAGDFLRKLIERRNHYPIAELLRFAVDESEYLTVIAANFDGARRLANVRKLFTLAERFEHAGAHLVRDFVRYVEEFEAIGSREGEGQIDDSANAVRLMTIHQAKGLEFKVVVIPNLHHRSLKPQEHWYALDRHRGLTVKIPDGRGKQVAGCTLESFRERNRQREHFESVRLLYVAATRAKDRLILAGVTDALAKLDGSADNWLKLIWQKLELEVSRSGPVNLNADTQLEVMLNLADESLPHAAPGISASVHPISATVDSSDEQRTEEVMSLGSAFPLLRPVAPEQGLQATRLQGFSVTQLINYQRCPRQYYFDRVLHAPSAEAIATWNDAEAPEPPANLTATLKGAVIHRFCETYRSGDDPSECLRQSFQHVTAARQAELAERWLEIDIEKVIKDLLPLANNYLTSAVFHRVEGARRLSSSAPGLMPGNEIGLWSELPFRVRRPLGILTGAIDKLLISRTGDNKGFDVEIIDFKTNRLLGRQASRAFSSESTSEQERARAVSSPTRGAGAIQQIAFDFSAPATPTRVASASESIDTAIERLAFDYQLQMQAYALAVRELIPSLTSGSHQIRVTLHFLEPNVEFHLSEDLLNRTACERAIDEAMRAIAAAREPEQFPVHPAIHCRMCNFLDLCSAGRTWLRKT
ncbi:MAG: ATP-dependent exoDNAse (contains helicase and exonuclease domain) [Acidobacteria bacterium]|nr:ATP-dependent exoDNAse (contains helicase and exonuclease domain) [Acidobacteriota bacterium]